MKAGIVIGLTVFGYTSLACAQVSCDTSYGFRADVVGVAGTQICNNKSTAFIDALKNFNLSNQSYTNTSTTSVFGRFNDVNVSLQYLNSSTTLSYSFPQLAVSGTFTGATRIDSQQQLENYLKKSNLLGQIMNYQAKNSPASSITGTGGIIPNAVNGEFDSNFTETASNIAGPKSQAEGLNNLMGVGVGFSSFSIDGNRDRIYTATVPLSYTIRNDLDPRRQLVLSAPLTMVSMGDAKSYSGSLGGTYRLPLSDHWTIAPGVRYSGIASPDRASVATVYTATLSSVYLMEFSGFDVAIGNMLAYNKTGKFSSGNYSFDPNISNTALRNGLMLSQPVNFGGSKYSLEYSLIDTRYFGDKPFTDNTQELGVTLGTNKSAYDARSFIRMGAALERGRGVNGYMLKLDYWF